MSENDSKQTLMPRDDDEQWQKVLRGEIEMNPDNRTHREAKEIRQYLLSTEIQDAVESTPDSHALAIVSPEEAKVKYQYASEEIHRRAKTGLPSWVSYGLIALFGIMAGLTAFFAAHYFTNTNVTNTPAPPVNSNRVDTQNFGDQYNVLKNGQTGGLPNLLPIPSGVLIMGCTANWDDIAGGCRDSEYPAHAVNIKAFEIAQNEVTVSQFGRFVEESNYKTVAEKRGCVIADTKSPSPRWIMDKAANWQSPGFKQEDSHPVVCIARMDALAYISWLNKITGKQYRLPTEAEWEYAARAGTATPYFWGNKADHNRANFKGTGGLDTWENTSPIGMFPANNFNIQDMSGNAWEWVSDCWHDNYVSAPSDGSSWDTNCHGNDFIPRRGGAWDAPPISIRSSYRSHAGEIDRSQSYGFRVAHDIKPTTNPK